MSSPLISVTMPVFNAGPFLVNAVRSIRAQTILDYYDLRLNLKIKFLNEGDKVVDWAEVFNANRQFGSYVAGIEKMTTDLTGGYISTAELRGYYKLVEDFYYTGEIIAGEEFGEM